MDRDKNLVKSARSFFNALDTPKHASVKTRELLVKYFRAVDLASGPDADRSKDWRSNALRFAQDIHDLINKRSGGAYWQWDKK